MAFPFPNPLDLFHRTTAPATAVRRLDRARAGGRHLAGGLSGRSTAKSRGPGQAFAPVPGIWRTTTLGCRRPGFCRSVSLWSKSNTESLCLNYSGPCGGAWRPGQYCLVIWRPPGFESSPRDNLACEFLPPAFMQADPVKQVQADVAKMEAGLTSRSKLVAARGWALGDLSQEIAADTLKPKEAPNAA